MKQFNAKETLHKGAEEIKKFYKENKPAIKKGAIEGAIGGLIVGLVMMLVTGRSK